MLYQDVFDAIGHTPLVGMPRMSPKPGVRLWAKLEGANPTGSTKDRIAKKMVEVAEASGELTQDHIILEPSSGNTGIALAMVARLKGYRLTVVIPDNASEERIRLLELFGAEVVYSPGDKGTNGSIEVARALAKDGRYFMPFQYGNPANPLAHEEGTAVEILQDLPELTHFVAGLGTGGTLTGNGRALHRHDPEHPDRRRRARARRPRLRAALARRRVRPADLRPERGGPEVPGELRGRAPRHATADLERRDLRRDLVRRRGSRRPAHRAARSRRATSCACWPTADGSTCPPRRGLPSSSVPRRASKGPSGGDP